MEQEGYTRDLLNFLATVLSCDPKGTWTGKKRGVGIWAGMERACLCHVQTLRLILVPTLASRRLLQASLKQVPGMFPPALLQGARSPPAGIPCLYLQGSSAALLFWGQTLREVSARLKFSCGKTARIRTMPNFPSLTTSISGLHFEPENRQRG